MSLRDDASLILIPSAIKDGEVLVQKPLPNKFSDETGNYDGNDPQGSANLTFTRNSNATRVDANGLVEKVRTNSLLQSNQFDTTWTTNNASVTSGQSGYDGLNNAWLLTATNTSSARLQQAESSTGVQVLSVYAKAGTANFLVSEKAGTNGFYAWFDLSNGTIGNTNGDIDTTIEDVGNGWYRCSISGNPSSGTKSQFYVAETNGSTTISVGASIYIQNAQLEQGLVATDYIATTTTAMSEFAGVTASSVADVPRLDYSGGATCPSLLLEPQRTNLVTYSEYFGAWTLGGTTTIDFGYLAPDGTNSAYKVTNVSSGSISYSGVADQNYSRTIYARTTSGTGTAQLCSYFGNTNNIFTITEEWQRFEVNTTTTTTGATNFYGVDFRGVGTLNEIILWGAQSENASYATSYIPTYGTTVTRLAETTKLLDMRSNGVSTTGAFTVFFDISDEQEDAASGDNSVIFATYINNLSSGIISARKYYQSNPDGNIRWFSDVDGGTMGYSNTTNKKWAAVCNGTSVKVFTDGTLVVNYTGTGSHNSLGSMQLNYGSSDRTVTAYKQCLVFPSALSDTECENLTA